MIDPRRMRNQLDTLPSRAHRSSESERWGRNNLELIPSDILPRIPERALAEVRRLAKMAQSIGARIVTTKRFGTIGEVNWGAGGSDALDRMIRRQDLDSLADKMLANAFFTGMIAGIVRRDPELQELRIEPMIGHVEPVYSEHSPTVIIGVVHAWQELFADAGHKQWKWVVRIYDLHARNMREWRNLATPAEAARRQQPAEQVGPTAEFPAGAPMPRFAVLETDTDGMPYGELTKVLPLVKSDWSSQIRADRAEENTAFPQLKIKGEAEDGTEERSSAHVIRLLDDGDAAFLEVGDLSQLHKHHDRKLERIREDAAMPGGFLGSDTPSGEALREANAKFISSCKWYAGRLGRVLTELVADLGEGLGERFPDGAGPEVTVQINREFAKDQEVEFITGLFREGLLPLSAAVRAVSVYVPTWSDEEVEQYIQEEERPTLIRPTAREMADVAL